MNLDVTSGDSRERAVALLERGLERQGADRERFVASVVGDDQRLRTTFEALLAAADGDPSLLGSAGLLEGPLGRDLVQRLAGRPALIGDSIGSVRLLEVLGEGGMGTVFKGHDKKLERTVAVKSVRPDRLLDPRARARFRREARTLSRLNHPGICQVYDLVERPEADYLVLELVDGETLRRWMAGEQRRAARLAVARRIVTALAAAHERGIVHRDLKPDNVMVTAAGAVKVLDFGIARAVDARLAETPTVAPVSGPAAPPPLLQETSPAAFGSLDPAKLTFRTGLGSVIGTLAYMSPEQARGDEVTAASDLFSLGALLQELFTGQPIHPTLPLGEILERARSGETLPATGLDPDLGRLLRELLAHDPEARPTAAQTDRRLAAIEEKPARRRRRGLALSGAVAAAALAAAAALFAWNLGRPRPLLAEGERARVALLPIENASGDPELDWVPSGLTELVARQLDHLEPVEILPTDRVASALEAASPDPIWTSAMLPELARQLGADLVIEAHAERLDGDLVLEYRPVRSGSRPGAWRSVSAAEPSEAANLLARQLALRLAPGAPQVELRDRFSADPHLNRLYAMGIARLKSGGGHAAESYFRVCVDRDPDFAWARAELAGALLEGGDFDEAEQQSRRAEEQAAKSGDGALLATARLRRSLVLSHRGEREEAEELARRAVVELRGGDDRVRLAEALGQLGQIAWERGDLDTAERLQEEALALARESGDPLATSRALRALGVVADTRWQLDRAVDLFHQALDAIHGVEVPVLRATILNSMGISLHYAGRLDEAKAAIREALELNRSVSNPAGEVANLVNLGDLALRRRDWAGAVEVLQPAVALAERLGFPRGRGTSAVNLAQALIRSGRLEEAERAVAIAAQDLGDEEWNVVGNRALLAYLRGDFATARAGLERSKQLAGPNWEDNEEELLATVRAAAADGRASPPALNPKGTPPAARCPPPLASRGLP